MSLSETIGQLLVRPLLGPFPPAQTMALARRGSLQKRLDAVAAAPVFTGMGIALIDMTGGRMEYAGVRDRMQLYGASLVKIVALFAAYALRERVRDVAKVYPADDRKSVMVCKGVCPLLHAGNNRWHIWAIRHALA